MLDRFPDGHEIPRYYALALAEFGDEGADRFFRKAVAMRLTFEPVADYAGYLLDRNENRKAPEVLQRLTGPEERPAYPHSLKGVALERIGNIKGAKKEYEAFVKDNTPPGHDPKTYKGGYKMPRKYRMPGSAIQGGHPLRRHHDAAGSLKPYHRCSKKSLNIGNEGYAGLPTALAVLIFY